MKKFLAIFALIFAICGYFIYDYLQNSRNSELKFYGNVDTKTINLAFRFLGEVNFRLEDGTSVKAGETIIAIDDSYHRNNLKTLQTRLEAEEIKLKKLQKGFRIEEIEAAKAKVDVAKANLNNAKQIFERRVRLFKANSVSKEIYEDSKNSYEIAKANLNLATAELNLRENGYEKEDILAQKKLIENLNSQINSAILDINNSKIKAPKNGFLQEVYKEIGALATPGEVVAELALSDEFFIRAYASGKFLAKLKLAQEIEIVSEAGNFTGTISYISDIAEFTPKQIQTEELRADLVYKIKIKVLNPNEKLKMGMPVTLNPK